MDGMFVDVSIVLARAESTILLFDEEERGCLWRVGRANLSGSEIFVEEVFGGFVFVRGERIYFPNLWGKGIVKIDLMIIRSRWGNVVGSFFGKHEGERGILWGECGFRFGFFCCSGKFHSCGQLSDDRGSCWNKAGSALDDLVNGVILPSACDVLILGFPVVAGKEVLVYDGVHIGVLWAFNGGSGEARLVSLSINGEGAEELLGLVEGLLDGEGSFNPVDRGIDVFQPRES